MLERRPMFGALIGLTLCFSLWTLSLQEAPNLNDSPQQHRTSAYPVMPAQQILSTEAHTTNSSTTAYISQASTSNYLDLLVKNDFSKLIDLDNFEFKLNQKSCNELQIQPLVLILVHSAPRNVAKRNVIRETWGETDPRSRLLFFLGDVAMTKLQDKIDRENKKYGDIVQGNFEDAYRNMTYKHVMVLKWFIYNCPEARYILKTDDDVFINTPNVYSYIENNLDRRKLLLCLSVEGSRVYRSYRSKWRVSTKEYSGRYYPDYCPGFSIIYSGDAAFVLYTAAQKTPYFWIDDVHVTGTLAKSVDLKIKPLGDFYLKEYDKDKLLDGSANLTTAGKFLFTTPNLKAADIRLLWKAVKT